MAVESHPIPARAHHRTEPHEPAHPVALREPAHPVALREHATDDVPLKRSWWSRNTAITLVTMIVTLSFILIWMRFVTPWWQGVQEQWQYGSTRITQVDTNVGHGGVSHFVAQYYHSEIVIIELVQSDPAQCHVYTLRGFYGVTTTPVVLLSVGATRHHGKPDLVVSIAGTDFAQTLYNTGSAFSQSEGQG